MAGKLYQRVFFLFLLFSITALTWMTANTLTDFSRSNWLNLISPSFKRGRRIFQFRAEYQYLTTLFWREVIYLSDTFCTCTLTDSVLRASKTGHLCRALAIEPLHFNFCLVTGWFVLIEKQSRRRALYITRSDAWAVDGFSATLVTWALSFFG